MIFTDTKCDQILFGATVFISLIQYGRKILNFFIFSLAHKLKFMTFQKLCLEYLQDNLKFWRKKYVKLILSFNCKIQLMSS